MVNEFSVLTGGWRLYKREGEMAGTMVSGDPLTEEQLRASGAQREAETPAYETQRLQRTSDVSCEASFAAPQV